jgi:hypothetical protein
VLTDGALDVTATAALRARLGASRYRVALAAADIEATRGRAIHVDETTAGALGVGVGGVVELVNPGGAPLRAWVVGLLPGNDRRAEIAPTALRMLALGDGSEVEIRAVHSGALGD